MMEWISVEEKIPNPVTRCIVYLDNGYIVIATYYLGYWKNDNGDYVYNITHWMLLSEPPKDMTNVTIQ